MNIFYKNQLNILSSLKKNKILDNILRGIEKENIRMSKNNKLSKSSHPKKLGSALTHPLITTDFSENLIECVTPPVKGRYNLFSELNNLMIFVNNILSNNSSNNSNSNYKKEYLWPYSMPYLPDYKSVIDIPLADYGSSNSANMKTTYRRGLENRYGKAMQVIAGLHYNFSFPKELLLELGPLPNLDLYTDKNISKDQAIITQRYMSVMRGFLQYQWLIPFLFGASPICFAGSVPKNNKPVLLQKDTKDKNIFISHNATSLRLSDIGYQNKSQSQIQICTNTARNYASSLLDATSLPYPEFSMIPIKNSKGNYNQLNVNLLQIENEFYSTIRPKPKIRGDYRPSVLLYNYGVDYLEIRCLDLNPFEPLGLSKETSAFIDLFLMHLLLHNNPEIGLQSQTKNNYNFKSAVESSRSNYSRVCIESSCNQLNLAARDILESMMPLAIIMDDSETNSQNIYTKTLQQQIDKTKDLSLLPSNQVINSWKQSGLKFDKWIIKLALEHQDIFNDMFKKNKLTQDQLNFYNNLVKNSLTKQKDIENSDKISFDEFLNNYFSQDIK